MLDIQLSRRTLEFETVVTTNPVYIVWMNVVVGGLGVSLARKADMSWTMVGQVANISTVKLGEDLLVARVIQDHHWDLKTWSSNATGLVVLRSL